MLIFLAQSQTLGFQNSKIREKIFDQFFISNSCKHFPTNDGFSEQRKQIFFSIKNVVNRCHDAPISLEKMHQRLFYNRLGSLRSVLQSALITFKCYSTHETTRNGSPLVLFKMVTSRLEQAFQKLTGKRETFQLSITNR